MSVRSILVLLAACGAAGALHAQDVIGFQPRPRLTNSGQLRLQSVAAIVEYSSGRDPFSISTPGVRARRFGGGGNASLGYFRGGERSQVWWAFTSSYVRRIHSAELNAWTNTTYLGWTRRVSPRLAVNIAGSGEVGSAADLLFMPSSSMQLAGADGTSDELASAVLSGNSTNPALARLVRARSSLNPQMLSLLYGRTALAIDGQVVLEYTYSPRLSFHWRSGGTRTQPWRRSADPVAGQPLVSQATSGFFQMGAKYALSPRTQVGLEVYTQRAHSRISDGYISSGMAYVGRKLTRRCFIELLGGIGSINPIRGQQSTSTQRGASYQAAGSLGYRNLSHTILFSGSRLVGDSYGLGATSTSGGGISWVWQRSGSGWWLGTDLNYRRLVGAANTASGGRDNLESRTVTQTIGRRIVASTVVQLQYLLTNFSSPIVTARGGDKYQHAARLSVVWVPGATSR